jgi:hypothetical protein
VAKAVKGEENLRSRMLWRGRRGELFPKSKENGVSEFSVVASKKGKSIERDVGLERNGEGVRL